MEILEILALQLDILERNLSDESKKENINHDAVNTETLKSDIASLERENIMMRDELKNKQDVTDSIKASNTIILKSLHPTSQTPASEDITQKLITCRFKE